jgi:hypothetical protein
VTLTSAEGGEVTKMPDSALERVRADNPSARLLPVLRALAGTTPDTIRMDLLGDQRLVVEIGP